MATETQGGGFLANLGKIYAIYTGGFLGFVILLGILEQVGVPERTIGFMFVGLTLLVYAGIGILSRTMQVSEYYVAGRSVPAFYNGMATAADWMSGASFLAMAGSLYLLGYDGLAFVLGWTGGYVLVAVLVAPYLRKFGAYTVPDFLAARFGGNMARFLGIVVLLAASFTYVVAQIRGTGLIAERFLGIPYDYGVFVGLGGILLCSMLGGMRAVTWTQVAQYIVLIIAYLIPVVIMSYKVTGVPIPQLMYGEALQQITALEQSKEALAGAKAHVTPYSSYTTFNFFALILCLMIGTASLPHVLMRYFTTPSVRAARKSVGWSLLFIFILYFTAPAYAAFAKLEIYQNVIGKGLDDLPAWIYVWGANAKVHVCGVAAASLDAIKAACSQAGTEIVRFQDFKIAKDVVVVATPEIAGLPFVITGLVGAGGLAAAMSTADGLLLAMANALSHDIYYRMIDRHCADVASSDRGPRHLVRYRDRGCVHGDIRAAGHPEAGGMGVLARRGRQLPGTCAGDLVEAVQYPGRCCRHDRRVRGDPVLPDLDGRAAARLGTRSVVQRGEHLGRRVRYPDRLHCDDRRLQDDARTVRRTAGYGRRSAYA